jgi:hypothetical protein
LANLSSTLWQPQFRKSPLDGDDLGTEALERDVGAGVRQLTESVSGQSNIRGSGHPYLVVRKAEVAIKRIADARYENAERPSVGLRERRQFCTTLIAIIESCIHRSASRVCQSARLTKTIDVASLG